jgi:hypothetical protein
MIEEDLERVWKAYHNPESKLLKDCSHEATQFSIAHEETAQGRVQFLCFLAGYELRKKEDKNE